MNSSPKGNKEMKNNRHNCHRQLYQRKVFYFLIFSLSTTTEEEISRVKLHSKFPFLLHDDLDGRAKRAARNQLQPQLLNSYQGHRGASITSLIYSENNQILISSSRDKTVRLWDLSGQVRVTFFARRGKFFVCHENSIKM
jgi:WD40 repeat protein